MTHDRQLSISQFDAFMVVNESDVYAKINMNRLQFVSQQQVSLCSFFLYFYLSPPPPPEFFLLKKKPIGAIWRNLRGK